MFSCQQNVCENGICSVLEHEKIVEMNIGIHGDDV